MVRIRQICGQAISNHVAVFWDNANTECIISVHWFKKPWKYIFRFCQLFLLFRQTCQPRNIGTRTVTLRLFTAWGISG